MGEFILLEPPIGQTVEENKVRIIVPPTIGDGMKKRGVPFVYSSVEEADKALRSLKGVTVFLEGDKVMQIGVPRCSGMYPYEDLGCIETPEEIGHLIRGVESIRERCHCPGLTGIHDVIVMVHYHDRDSRETRFPFGVPRGNVTILGFDTGPWGHLATYEWPSLPPETPFGAPINFAALGANCPTDDATLVVSH